MPTVAKQKPKPASDLPTAHAIDDTLIATIEDILSDAGPSRREVTETNFHIDNQLTALADSLSKNNLSRRDFDRHKQRLESTRIAFQPDRRRDAILRAVAFEDRLRDGLAASGERLCVLLDLKASHALTPALLQEMRALENFRDGAQRVRNIITHARAELQELLPDAVKSQLAGIEAAAKWTTAAPSLKGEGGALVEKLCKSIRKASTRMEEIVLTVPWGDTGKAASEIWTE